MGLGIVEIPLTGEIGILSAELEGLPGDPADRIITATALLRGHTLLTGIFTLHHQILPEPNYRDTY